MKTSLTAAIAFATASVLAVPALAQGGMPITTEEVEAAQAEWGQGIVDISAVYTQGGDYEARARQHLDTLYNYGNSMVLFKPTLAAEDQFRGTYDEALSYFVRGKYAEDSGFAIKGWTNVRFENEGIVTDDDNAIAMGNYYFTGPDGSVTKVEYTFGYVRGADGKLKINTHHSSVPFQPATQVAAAN
ncbi:phosphoribosyl-AMP cyclohydrolase [Erythrobacter sp. JL475]|jgi:hypothetical protein|nr:phosphoribosyl-AMP cyclohydrolase [Erythrobacter sp. JL475]